MEEFDIIKRIMGLSPLVAHYTNQLYSDPEEGFEDFFLATLEENRKRYELVEEIKILATKADDLEAEIQAIVSVFPSFFINIALDLNERTAFQKQGRSFLIASLSSFVNNTPKGEEYSKIPLKALDPESSLADLKKLLDDQPKITGYLPAVLKKDLNLVGRNQHIRYSSNKFEQIENLYCFLGLTQIYLKVFFDLLCGSSNDVIAQHLDHIFLPMFISLRKQEIEYIKSCETPVNEIYYLIEADQPNKRHPHIRQQNFDTLYNFNPIINNGKARKTSVSGQTILRGQLLSLSEMPPTRLILFLSMVQLSKGRDYVQNMLSQLQRQSAQIIKDLDKSLQNARGDRPEKLNQIVQSFVSKQSGQTLGTNPMGNKPGAKALPVLPKKISQFNIKKYLEDNLKRLYERAKIEGALRADQVPGYLAHFISASESMMTAPILDLSSVIIYEKNTGKIVKHLGQKARLGKAAMDEREAKINKKMQQLKDSKPEERADIIADIGNELMDLNAEAMAVEVEEGKGGEDTARQVLLASKIIPMGLEKGAEMVKLSDFLSFPLGPAKGPNTKDWYYYHIRFMELLVIHQRLPQDKFEQIQNILSEVPITRYKKYFDIFPAGQYDDSILMAVFSLWQNQALNNLRIEEG